MVGVAVKVDICVGDVVGVGSAVRMLQYTSSLLMPASASQARNGELPKAMRTLRAPACSTATSSVGYQTPDDTAQPAYFTLAPVVQARCPPPDLTATAGA